MRAQRGAGFGIVSYIVMGVVIVLILVGGLLLVSSMTSSSPSELGVDRRDPDRHP